MNEVEMIMDKLKKKTWDKYTPKQFRVWLKEVWWQAIFRQTKKENISTSMRQSALISWTSGTS